MQKLLRKLWHGELSSQSGGLTRERNGGSANCTSTSAGEAPNTTAPSWCASNSGASIDRSNAVNPRRLLVIGYISAVIVFLIHAVAGRFLLSGILSAGLCATAILLGIIALRNRIDNTGSILAGVLLCVGAASVVTTLMHASQSPEGTVRAFLNARIANDDKATSYLANGIKAENVMNYSVASYEIKHVTGNVVATVVHFKGTESHRVIGGGANYTATSPIDMPESVTFRVEPNKIIEVY